MKSVKTVAMMTVVGLLVAGHSRADVTTAIGLLSASLSGAARAAEKAESSMNRAASRARDIYVAIVCANTEREPLGLGDVWPKAGKKKEGNVDVPEMRFENSSDFFSVLLDGENMNTPNWAPYVCGLDWTKFAGGGIPPKVGAGRLTAENNIWIIAANITDEMEDIIPFIITRNVDPASLIPKEGDLREQRIRPSPDFKTPFGDEGFIIVRKGGSILKCPWGEDANLHTLYQGQKVRDAFQKIKYLTP